MLIFIHIVLFYMLLMCIMYIIHISIYWHISAAFSKGSLKTIKQIFKAGEILYKNILFDIGGVLIEYNPRLFLLNRFGNEELENKLFDITFNSDTWVLVDKGQITRTQANKIMLEKGAKIGRKFEVNTIINEWQDILITKEDTSKLLKILKYNNYNLFYATNMPKDTLEMLKRRHFWPLFAGGISSCDINIVKPDFQFFKFLLLKYKLDASETIFIDDNLSNVMSARELGICAIHFKGAENLARQLYALGVNLSLNKKTK